MSKNNKIIKFKNQISKRKLKPKFLNFYYKNFLLKTYKTSKILLKHQKDITTKYVKNNYQTFNFKSQKYFKKFKKQLSLRPGFLPRYIINKLYRKTINNYKIKLFYHKKSLKYLKQVLKYKKKRNFRRKKIKIQRQELIDKIKQRKLVNKIKGQNFLIPVQKKLWVDPKIWATYSEKKKNKIRNIGKKLPQIKRRKWVDPKIWATYSVAQKNQIRNFNNTFLTKCIYKNSKKIKYKINRFLFKSYGGYLKHFLFLFLLKSNNLIFNQLLFVFKKKYIICLFLNKLLNFILRTTSQNQNKYISKYYNFSVASAGPHYNIIRKSHKKYRWWLWRRRKRFVFRRIVARGVERIVYRTKYHHKKEYKPFLIFRKFFWRQFARFRHISKNKLFINLFRGNFKHITGYNEKTLMAFWFQFRRKQTKIWGGNNLNLVYRFTQAILLIPPHFVVFLGLTPTLSSARSIITFGGVVINGMTKTNLNSFIKPGDIVQIVPSLWATTKQFYFFQQWSFIKLKLNFINFVQIDWSLFLFIVVSWPKSYELVPSSYLSERWVRYYIRHFPVRQARYQKVKTVWKRYSLGFGRYAIN